MIKTTTLDGVHYWSRFQADRGIDFNAFLLRLPAGNLLVDPLELAQHELDDVREKGGASWILVTNFDHLRAACELKLTFEAELIAPAADRDRFGDQRGAVDHWVETSADLPAELASELQLISLRGGKSPVELALYFGKGVLLFGDLVRSHVSGELRLLPPPKIADPAAVADSLAPLRELEVHAVLLGDGDSLFRDAGPALLELLDSLS